MPVDRRPRRRPVTDRVGAWLIEETPFGRGARELVERLRGRVTPLHWTSMFGAVTLACLGVLVGTGLYLMFFYTPSNTAVTYAGSYAPLRGVPMSKALESTLEISFEVRGGLLLRQAHHWAALILPASLLLQLLAAFFPGAFRRPREWGWVLLVLAWLLALAGGWSGYALPDDMLAGTGLRIFQGIVLAIPFAGTWAAGVLFGDGFPGEILERLYPVHVVIVPALLLAVVAARIRLAYRQEPPQFRGPGRTEDNVVGVPVWPDAAARYGGVAALTVGVLLLLAGTATVSPVWLNGPSSPGSAGAGSQPDWYTGFLDGALRLVPPGWEVDWLGRTWALAILVPLAVVTVFVALVAVYPFLERWATGDRREHHLLDRPRNAPVRTGIGVAAIVFYAVLQVAGSADVLALTLGLGLESVIVTLQAALVLGPPIAFEVARRVALGLQRRDRDLLISGIETGSIVRLPSGGYAERHRPLDPAARERLRLAPDVRPPVLRPDEAGRISVSARLRARLAQRFAEDRLPPLPDASGSAAPETADDPPDPVDGTSAPALTPATGSPGSQ